MFRCAAVSAFKHTYMATAAHAHPRFEVVVVTDDADVPEWLSARNADLAAALEVPYVRGVEQALEQHAIDVAIIGSEVERHCDLTVRAADHGAHIIQDKPMSTTLAECERAVAAVERNDVRFMLWNRNTMPAVLDARALLRDGAVGDIYAIHVDFYFAKDAGPPKRRAGAAAVAAPQRAPVTAPAPATAPVQAPLGELNVEGIYPLAYIQTLVGARVERVYARTTAHFHQANVDFEVDDLATVSLEMAGGVLGSLCLGRIGAASHPDIGEIKIHILGSEGALVIAERRPQVSIYYRDQPLAEYRNPSVASSYEFLIMEDFARAIDAGGETLLGVRVARDIFATVQAAIASGGSGLPVAVD